MRTKDTLLEMNDIAILYQYLYMDEKHNIIFNNGLTDLIIHMNESLSVMCKNLKFPDIPEMNWTENLTPANCLGIINILKGMPPEEYKNSIKNRWEEIKTITLTNLSLNKKWGEVLF